MLIEKSIELISGSSLWIHWIYWLGEHYRIVNIVQVNSLEVTVLVFYAIVFPLPWIPAFRNWFHSLLSESIKKSWRICGVELKWRLEIPAEDKWFSFPRRARNSDWWRHFIGKVDCSRIENWSINVMAPPDLRNIAFHGMLGNSIQKLANVLDTQIGLSRFICYRTYQKGQGRTILPHTFRLPLINENKPIWLCHVVSFLPMRRSIRRVKLIASTARGQLNSLDRWKIFRLLSINSGLSGLFSI